MDEGQIMTLFMSEVKHHPVLSEDETTKLIIKYKETNDQNAYKKLTAHNLGLAVKIAKQYENKCKTMSLLDLIQENSLILMDAITKYDMNKGVKLSDYIGKIMSLKLQRRIDETDDTIRVSVHLKKSERKYNRCVEKYEKTTGKRPTQQEIKQDTNLSATCIKMVENLSEFQPHSLDQKYSIESDNATVKWVDMISNEKDPYENYENNKDTIILLKGLYDFLSKEEYYTLYYRELCQTQKTLEQIGEELGGLTAETIRVRVKNILWKVNLFLSDIQAVTIAKYGIDPIDTRELVPLEPKKRLALYYLKHNMNELPYHVIYTKLCNPEKDSLEYYKSEFPQKEQGNLENTIERMPEFMDNFLTEERMEKIYSLCKNDLTIPQILEMNITPKEKSKEQKESAEFMNFLTSDDLLMQILTTENKESKEGTIVKTPYTKGSMSSSVGGTKN